MKDLTRFAAALRGSIVRQGEAGYDGARKLCSAMIARCVEAADVIAAVAILAFAGGHESRDRQPPP